MNEYVIVLLLMISLLLMCIIQNLADYMYNERGIHNRFVTLIMTFCYKDFESSDEAA